MTTSTQPGPRSRAALFVGLGAAVALGLASRHPHPWVPAWVAANAGDALWTVAVYIALGILRPAAAPGRLALLALGISVAVELSQLLRAGWLDALRSTLPGRLLLGQGWQWADLPRYAAGAALAFCIDGWAWRRRPAKR